MRNGIKRWLVATALFAPLSAGVAVAGWGQTGLASWYGTWHHGRLTASGERFNMRSLTAAHRTLPLGTWIRVTNLVNGKSVDVGVNDRGPMIPGRVVDLSRAAAREIGSVTRGIVPARIDVLEMPSQPAPQVAGARRADDTRRVADGRRAGGVRRAAQTR